ncbi:MarR family winged helix-turn-helix transcriptional regulator [Nocardioides sp. R-C-SC26]|uniref:MarR family winged helix-turn-helix transcriptional regulator n=1 Tax=Nocardioides sp. R-C-SC26 TaxID=2870414 RepID=UPI001E440D39|nr:MarR family transcriptional regulator [Nocardioides sp. R-C-SC26]
MPDQPLSLSLLIKQSEATLRSRLQPVLDAAGLSAEQWRVVGVLLDAPGTRMTELADAAVVPAATLTRLVDRLVEDGVVVRRVDPDDRRRVVGALSPRGAEVARDLRAAEERLERELRAGLGPDRFDALVADLTTIVG